LLKYTTFYLYTIHYFSCSLSNEICTCPYRIRISSTIDCWHPICLMARNRVCFYFVTHSHHPYMQIWMLINPDKLSFNSISINGAQLHVDTKETVYSHPGFDRYITIYIIDSCCMWLFCLHASSAIQHHIRHWWCLLEYHQIAQVNDNSRTRSDTLCR
jgi:hypothetical protein